MCIPAAITHQKAVSRSVCDQLVLPGNRYRYLCVVLMLLVKLCTGAVHIALHVVQKGGNPTAPPPDAPLSHTPGCFRVTDFHLRLIIVTAAGPKEITALAKALAYLPQRVIWKLSAKEVARAGGLATMNLTANIKVSTVIPSYTRAPILPCLP